MSGIDLSENFWKPDKQINITHEVLFRDSEKPVEWMMLGEDMCLYMADKWDRFIRPFNTTISEKYRLPHDQETIDHILEHSLLEDKDGNKERGSKYRTQD